MNAQQNIVGAAGLGLVAANFWTKQRAAVSAGAFNSSASSAASEKGHEALVTIGAELLFVGVATLLAGASASFGNAMIAVVIALGILWIINYQKGTK